MDASGNWNVPVPNHNDGNGDDNNKYDFGPIPLPEFLLKICTDVATPGDCAVLMTFFQMHTPVTGVCERVASTQRK